MKMTLAVSCLAATLAVGSSVFAAPVLDQQFVPVRNDANGTVDADVWRAQTVNAGLSGYLFGVDIYGVGAGDLFLDIMSTRSGGGSVYSDPLDSVLGTVLIPGASLSSSRIEWLSVDVRSLSLYMNAGTQFGIRLREKSAPGSFSWYGDFFRTGADVIYTRGSTWQPGAGNDGLSFGFRTFVDESLQAPSQVPEAGATVVLLTGSVALFVAVRRPRLRR